MKFQRAAVPGALLVILFDAGAAPVRAAGKTVAVNGYVAARLPVSRRGLACLDEPRLVGAGRGAIPPLRDKPI